MTHLFGLPLKLYSDAARVAVYHYDFDLAWDEARLMGRHRCRIGKVTRK